MIKIAKVLNVTSFVEVHGQHLQKNGSVAPFSIETGDDGLPLLLGEDHGVHGEQGEEEQPHLKPGHHDQTCPLNSE